MYLNGSLHSLNNSLNNGNLIELDEDDNLALSTTTSIQTNIISQSSGSNSNLNKFNLIQNTTLLQQQQQQFPCKLCGTQTATMRCVECMNMQLCYSCDSSFHQHPKRRTHKRKSINSLNTTTNYFSNDDTGMLRHSSSSSINNLPNQQLIIQSNEQKNAPFKQIRGLEHSSSSFSNNKNFSPISSAAIVNAHPTNMPPLPPPRRKKSRNPNEPIIMNNLRGLPGVDQRAYNNPLSSSCGNLAQLNRQSPMHFKMNNQFSSNNNAFANYSNSPMNRRQSYADNWQTSKLAQANLMQQTPQNYMPISPQPFNNLHSIRNLQQLQNLQNLQNQQTKILNPYQLQRHNLSLTDINSKNAQLLANGINPALLPYSFDMNSLSQSMDDLMAEDESFSDDDNYSSNSSRKHRQINKKNNSKNVKRSSSRGSSLNENHNLLNNKKMIRRSQSSALINSMPLNPYDFDYMQQNQLLANLYYAQPLLNTGISPANSIRSLEPVKRKSSVSSMMSNRTLVNNNELYNDVDRSRSSRYRRSNDKQVRGRSKSLCRSKSQSSNRSGKSFKSTYDHKSGRCASSESEDLNEKESECSMDSTSNCSNLDESTQSEFEEEKSKANKKKWKCSFCTFVNRIQMNICEICAKSNPQVLKQDNNLGSTNKKASLNNIKQPNRSRSKTRNEVNQAKEDNQQRTGYVEFTDELIKQQEEVEKELLRRIANEKLVEEENLKLEKEKKKLTNKANDKSRTAINSNENENKNTNLNDETNESINKSVKTNPLSAPPASNINNVKNMVSKIKPPSISLKQSTAFNRTNTNKLVKTHSLDSSTYQGRQREEHLKAKQSSFGKSPNVQQSSYFKSTKPEEQKDSNDHLVDQPVKENSDSSGYDMMEMFKLLKEAEKKDYLAEELEIALSFNSSEPINWLDNNWPSMKETVLTLANNQLLTICQESNSNFLTVNEEDARSALRFTKGNIWQAVDRCISLKKDEIKEIQAKKPVYTEKYDVKSFTFNLKSLGQGNQNRDGNKFNTPAIKTIKPPTIQINKPVELSNSQINKMESLLNGWYETNLKAANQNNTDESKPKTSEKVKNLIVFLKKNGFFDTNQLNQEEIDNQMKILMNLLEQKLKETQENNLSNSLNNSNNSSRSSVSFKSSNSANSSNLNRSNNSNLIDLSSSNNQGELSKIDQEFEEIDEKMKQSLNCLEEIEQEAKKKSNENLNKKSPDLIEKREIKNPNIKNLKITSKILVSDDKLDNDFQDASDKLNLETESVHNVNIKLNVPVVEEATANFNLKKEKGKIKIIKRKIYRNNSSEQKCIEKIAYVNDIKEADLINLDIDDEINLNLSNNKEDKEADKENNQDQIKEERVHNDSKKSNEPLMIDDDVEKKLNHLNPNFQFARTYYDCELCASKHHINELVSMLFCTHRACKSCLVKYFTIQIREKQRVVIKCPFCDQPDISPDDENAVHEYLTLLQELMKNIVSKELYELFQRKVRDRALQKDPSFKWCLKCCSGFVAANIEGPILRCPDCLSLSCSKCGELWKEEHRILTCDQFKQWMLNGDDFMAEHKLKMHLDAFGIICPKCRFRYELSKGGCLHFTCSQCGFEFCYGCDSEFTQKCSNTKFCEKLGLHCHHPRHCLYYLRDKKTEDLEKLLKLNNIDYEIKDYDKDKIECDIMEQKEIDDGFVDEPCKRKIEKNGLCSIHYVEHLAKLIKCNHVDPITIFDENELANVLRRELIDVPKRIDYTSKTYRSKLIETIEKHLPM